MDESFSTLTKTTDYRVRVKNTSENAFQVNQKEDGVSNKEHINR